MKNNILQDFYDLCDIADDNLNMVVELVHFHHYPEERISRVKNDIMDWVEIDRLERYAKTFDKILSLPNLYIKTFIAIKQGKINSQIIKIDKSKIKAKEKQYKKQEVVEHFINSLFEEYE